MENFLTWDMLLTYGGCVAATILVTEFFKKLFPKMIAQLVSFVIAAAILVVGHLATGTFSVNEVLLYAINAIIVSLASNGGFDAIKGVFGKKEEAPGQIIIDTTDADGEGAYLSFETDPTQFKDGDLVTFRVKKISQK